MNNFDKILKMFKENGLAQNNTKVDLPETPQLNNICIGYNNHFGLYNNTHMHKCVYEWMNMENHSLIQIPCYIITGSAVLNKVKFNSFLCGGCMPYGWTKSTIEGLNYKSVSQFLFDKNLFGCYGARNGQPAYFVFDKNITTLLGEQVESVLTEITGDPKAINYLYPCLTCDNECTGVKCVQNYTSLGESKIDTKQFENKSVFEIAELFGEGCQVFVEENKLEIFNNNNKYSFILEKI